MKNMLHAASLGSILILMASGCSKRDQYQRGAVPANPDPLNTSLTSLVTPPEPANGQAGSGAVSDLSAAEIVAKVSEWNAQPVMWNEAAGNIKIGETNWDDWYNTYLAYRRDGRVNFGFLNFDVIQGVPFCDLDQKNGANVCSTTSGVYLLQNYEGAVKLPDPSNALVDVRMNTSLRDSVYSEADRKGVVLVGEQKSDTTRGKEFFRRLYNKFVAPYYSDVEVDCFPKYCNYDANEQFYLWYYNAPGGMHGNILVSRDEDRIIRAYFSRPSIPMPTNLYTENSTVDLLSGLIDLPSVNGGTKFQIGETAEKFATLGLPPAKWAGGTGVNSLEFSGFYASFTKRNQERLADAQYSQAEPNDTVDFMYFDSNYEGSIKAGGLRLDLNNEERLGFSKAQHVKALEDLRIAVEKEILVDPNNKILLSRILGDGSASTQYGSFTLELIYELKGKVFHFTFATYLKQTSAVATLDVLEDYEVAVMQPRLSPPEEGGKVVAFGPLEIGQPVNLVDIDLDLTSRATVVLGEAKQRVLINKFQKTRVSRIVNGLPDIVTYDEVLKFAVGSLTVDVVPCSKLGNAAAPGYCVLSLYSDQFTWPGKQLEFNKTLREIYAGSGDPVVGRKNAGYLTAEIPTCGENTFIRMGQSKDDALANLSQCGGALSDSTESATTDKTIFYLHQTSNGFRAGGENNRFVALFQFY